MRRREATPILLLVLLGAAPSLQGAEQEFVATDDLTLVYFDPSGR